MLHVCLICSDRMGTHIPPGKAAEKEHEGLVKRWYLCHEIIMSGRACFRNREILNNLVPITLRKLRYIVP